MSFEMVEKLFQFRSFGSLCYKIQNKKIEVSVVYHMKSSSCLIIDNSAAVFLNKDSMFDFLKKVFYSDLKFNLTDQF